MIRAAMWDRLFDGAANAFEIVRKVACVEVRLNGHHSTADVHAHRGRDDRALGGDHAAHRRSNAPVHVRHGGNPFEDERELSDVQELFQRLIFELDALGPRFDRHAVFRGQHVVVLLVRHGGKPDHYRAIVLRNG